MTVPKKPRRSTLSTQQLAEALVYALRDAVQDAPHEAWCLIALAHAAAILEILQIQKTTKPS